MGHEGIILVNSPISTFQQSLTHSAMSVAHPPWALQILYMVLDWCDESLFCFQIVKKLPSLVLRYLVFKSIKHKKGMLIYL